MAAMSLSARIGIMQKFAHEMLKEIYEQPDASRRTLSLLTQRKTKAGLCSEAGRLVHSRGRNLDRRLGVQPA